VILVPSPLVMAMAGGTAAVWWYLFEKDLLGDKNQRGPGLESAIDSATMATTEAAIRAAIIDPIRAATSVATGEATREAIRAATRDLGEAATRAATDFETDSATEAATRAATDAATSAATDSATRVGVFDATGAATDKNWLGLAASFVGEEWALPSLRTAQQWAFVYQGGNMWAPWDCYITAARDILGLRLESHATYACWEQATINGGFRWMHPKFCFVSDFPEVLRINARNQPHAEFGPSHRWRDGWSLWHLNGVKVEQWMAESRPDEMDARRVLQIENVDQRAEVIRRLGMDRIVHQLDPAVLDTERREMGGEYRLLAVEMNHGEPWRFLQMVNQSTGATHIEAVPRECETVRHALNWRATQNVNEDWFPAILS
jgi:hypothetical protein